MTDEGFVYMAHLENRGRNGKELYKIGKTVDPQSRLSQLIRDFGAGIRFVALAYVSDCNSVEKLILKSYSDSAFKGIKWSNTNCTEMVSLTKEQAEGVISNINNLNPEHWDTEFHLNLYNGECFKNVQLLLSKLSTEEIENMCSIAKSVRKDLVSE